MGGTAYHKLWAPYKRQIVKPHALIIGEWARPEFDVLCNQDQDWSWTEKVNGTNARVIWDGHKVRFGGRTDEAQMPIILHDVLTDMFPEELLENQFHDTPAVLYGEGYGAKVASGSGVYRPDPGFVLFDVNVAGWWLEPDNVTLVGRQMGIESVPIVFVGSVDEAISRVKDPVHFVSGWGNFQPEGLVGKPPSGLMGRDGDRLMIKIKVKDFPHDPGV